MCEVPGCGRRWVLLTDPQFTPGHVLQVRYLYIVRRTEYLSSRVTSAYSSPWWSSIYRYKSPLHLVWIFRCAMTSHGRLFHFLTSLAGAQLLRHHPDHYLTEPIFLRAAGPAENVNTLSHHRDLIHSC